MYVGRGLGDTAADITPTAYQETLDNAVTCPGGTTLVNGVCSGAASSFTTWLQTGNNALYLGGGALAFFWC